MELDVQDWKEFKVGRLFRLEPTKGIISDDLIEGKDIPYIGAKHDTNGYMMMCKREDFENWISEGNCIVFIQLGAGSAGYVNYLPTDFIGMNGKTICGYIDGVLNSYIGLFLETILCQERPKYSFGRSWTGDRLKETKIALPIKYNSNKTPYIDKNGTYSDEGYIPDWQFMEDYIKSLHHKPITTKVKSGLVKELDVYNWEEFKVSDLFDRIYKAKAHTKEEVVEVDKGIHFVSRTDCNNGVDITVDKDTRYEGLEEANCITIGDTTATVFYQNERFIAGDHMVVLRANWLNLKRGLFFRTLFAQEGIRYCYGRAYRMDLIKSTLLKLPIQRDNDGTPVIDDNQTYSDSGYIPDWQFMEDYINSLPYSDRI